MGRAATWTRGVSLERASWLQVISKCASSLGRAEATNQADSIVQVDQAHTDCGRWVGEQCVPPARQLT
eukprot:1282140-Prymnesium_polylepis.3